MERAMLRAKRLRELSKQHSKKKQKDRESRDPKVIGAPQTLRGTLSAMLSNASTPPPKSPQRAPQTVTPAAPYERRSPSRESTDATPSSPMRLNSEPLNFQDENDSSSSFGSERSSTGSPTSPKSGNQPSKTLKCLGGSDYKQRVGIFDEIVARTLNSSLRHMNRPIFQEDHIVKLFKAASDGPQPFTMLDALQDLAVLLNTTVLIVEVVATLKDAENSIVRRIHAFSPDSVKTVLKSSQYWKSRLDVNDSQFVFSTDTSTLEIMEKQCIDYSESLPWVHFFKCQLILDRSCLQQLFARLGFFEPSCMMFMDDLPTNFPPDQYRMGACLVLQCSSTKFTIQEMDGVEKTYQYVCNTGGYKIKRSDLCGRYQVHAKTNVQDRVVVKDTLAELALHMHQRLPGSIAPYIHGSDDSVSSIKDVEKIINNVEELEKVSSLIDEEAVLIDRSGNFNSVARDRGGNTLAEHADRITLVRYLAVMYGSHWRNIFPRKLSEETRALMKSSIVVKSENAGRVSCVILFRRKPQKIFGTDLDHLFDNIWRKFDEAWVNVVQLLQRETSPVVVSVPDPIPDQELQLMRARLVVYYGHSRNTNLLCARTILGGHARTGETREELYREVWNRYGPDWQFECILRQD